MMSSHGDDYILPEAEIVSNLQEVSARPQSSYLFRQNERRVESLEQFIRLERAFVVAEPGLGKSRLLREVARTAADLRYRSAVVDLKKVEARQFGSTLNQCLTINGIPQGTSSEHQLICLDGLDEVARDGFPQMVEAIRDYAYQDKDTFLFIACRWHFFRKYGSLLSDLGFKYVRIFPFTREQVVRYLEQNDFSITQIGTIFDSLQFQDRDLVIQTPRYLELFAAYVKEKGLENLQALTRSDLLDHFIYKKLRLEDDRLIHERRDLVKRVLEKLALVMEIYRANLLTKDELMTFFDDVKSDLKVNLLQHASIEVFYEKSLLKNNDETVEFDNAEFQEYLAAKEIGRLGRSEQVAFDLAVDPELREIYPSWYNTLTFLVDQDISLLRRLLNLRSNSGEWPVRHEEYHRFLTRIDVNRLPDGWRREIIRQVFGYYQSTLRWMDYDVARSLARYWDPSFHAELRDCCEKAEYTSETERFVQQGNVALLVGFLLESGKFDLAERRYWRAKLIEFTHDRSENGVLQQHALSALSYLADPSVLADVADVWANGDNLLRQNLLRLCQRLDPNHEISVRMFVEGVKDHVPGAREGFYVVRSAVAIKCLLGAFVMDSMFLYSFLEHERIYQDRDHIIIGNIAAVWDKGIGNQLEEIVLSVLRSDLWYLAEGSSFLKDVISLVYRRRRLFPKRLVGNLVVDGNIDWRLFSNVHLLSCCVDAGKVGDLVKWLSPYKNGEELALAVLSHIRHSGESEAETIYDEGRSCLPALYADAERRQKAQSARPSRDEEMYADFHRMLEPAPGMYDPNVFNLYANQKAAIAPRMTAEDRDRLASLLTGTVFKHFDPREAKLTITREEGASTTYETSEAVRIFGDSLKVALDLRLDVTEFRGKILSYIPFAYSDQLEALFDLVPDMRPEEVEELLSVYYQKDSDLWRHLPQSFISAALKYHVLSGVPILRELAADARFLDQVRCSALEASEELRPDRAYLGSVFSDNVNPLNSVAEKANELLVTRHGDVAAARWRLEQIRTRVFTFAEPKGAHAIGPQEAELHYMAFARPLLTVNDPALEDDFIDIFHVSIDLFERDPGYSAYANYLWQIVKAYFLNRRTERSFNPLARLESRVRALEGKEGTNWFKGIFAELKQQYFEFIGKPTSVAECVQIYNRLKERQYLRIATEVELYETIKDLIDKDLRDWVYGEGSKLLHGYRESDIQKILSIQIQNLLLRSGFIRPQEVTSIREAELADGTKTDFLFYYGFLGPVMLELKLSDHADLVGDIQGKESFRKFRHYIGSYRPCGSIFLVLDNKRRGLGSESWESQLAKIAAAYQALDRVQVIGVPSPRIS